MVFGIWYSKCTVLTGYFSCCLCRVSNEWMDGYGVL